MEIECIHFYVVDAAQTRDLLIKKMGLQVLGDRITIRLEKRVNEHTIEYLVGNSHLLFSISSPLNSASPVANYLQLHPSGVQNISFRVPDLDSIRQKINNLEIKILAASSIDSHEFQWLRIQGWGSIEHTIIQASSVLVDSNKFDLNESIIGIDHLVLNVATGELAAAVAWYQNLFDFQVQQTFDIQTARSGLTSKALVSSCGKIKFNINEPSSSNSQIQEFLDVNRGAGIQHIALETNHILQTIDQMQQQELAFLSIAKNYYTQLRIRAKAAENLSLTDDEWQKLESLQILIDWSGAANEALLLQIFTEPIFEAPTFFFEVIERRNRAQGFGQGNFQALFEAIEQSSDFRERAV
jgi:4-hydroxyphenylpyruvate dioxygenase